MSNLELASAVQECGGREETTAQPVRQLLSGRELLLGESTNVRRLLPNLDRRMVGAWCFVDHYGPDQIAAEPGMQVPPHPHTGLQTVSWLRSGEIEHRDSLGTRHTLRPGRLGLMTSGSGISHSEQSPIDHGSSLHGAQLWIALPDHARHVAPAWEQHAILPVVTGARMRATVIVGDLDGAMSPATTYSPLFGAELSLTAGADVRLPIQRDFEYAAAVMSGKVEVDGVIISPGQLLYLGCGRRELRLGTDRDGDLLLLGGEPFDEKIVMWWNFIGRSAAEISHYRKQWQDTDAFGTVDGYDGARLAAPPLPPTPLRARGRQR